MQGMGGMSGGGKKIRKPKKSIFNNFSKKSFSLPSFRKIPTRNLLGKT